MHSLPVQWELELGAEASPLDDKFFFVEGELVGPHAHATILHVPDSLFGQVPGGQTIVPEVGTILTTLAGDPTVGQMGPYAGGGTTAPWESSPGGSSPSPTRSRA